MRLADLSNEQIEELRKRAQTQARAILAAERVVAPDPHVVSDPATRTPATIAAYNLAHARFVRDRRRRQAAEEVLAGSPREEALMFALRGAEGAKDDAKVFEVQLDALCPPHERVKL